MYKKYFAGAIRHLQLNPLFTTLNIAGLAIGISACLVIYRLVDYEFSWDNHLPDKEHIYRVVSGFLFDEKPSYNGGVSEPVYTGLRKEAAGMKRVVPLFQIWVKAVKANTSDGKPVTVENPEAVALTDAAYFSMVPYRWLAGQPKGTLIFPNQVVLTASRAKQYFPGRTFQDMLNKTLTYYGWNDTITRTVAGIVADKEGPTEFGTKEFCSLPLKEYSLASWTNTNGTDRLYIQLEENAVPATVLATIERVIGEKVRQFEQQQKDFALKRWFQLVPMKESHFSEYINEYNVHKANKHVLYGLMGVGVFLLVLACINYINMGVASIPKRSKEIGVRKTLGSSRSALISQFLAETLLTTLLACVLAFGLGWAEFWLLKDILPDNLEPWGKIGQVAGFLGALVVVVTLVSGLYPAWLITRIKTVHVFRKVLVFNNRSGRISLQKALIVFQFVIALAFIAGAMIVGSQLHYAIDSDMGFNKDAVVLVNVPWKYLDNPLYKNRQYSLLAELKTLPGIKGAALGSEPLSANYSSSLYSYYREGKPPISRNVYRKGVDTAYLRLYGFHLLAGRNLRPSDTANELVINETAVKAFGFASPEEALGKPIGQKDDGMYPVVGVVKDFHMQNFYKSIDPMAFMADREISTLNIKLDNAHVEGWQQTLKAIEKKWYGFYPPGSWAYTFYDEAITELYTNERHLSTLINLTTAISIFISCLGLFGLAVLTAYQRTKEIGIRKVLGASVLGIVGLLSKEFVRLVALAIIIALPIAWWAGNKWLQNFAYKVPLSWWLFAAAGVSGLAVALLTVGFRALKAARVNPVNSLRSE